MLILISFNLSTLYSTEPHSVIQSCKEMVKAIEILDIRFPNSDMEVEREAIDKVFMLLLCYVMDVHCAIGSGGTLPHCLSVSLFTFSIPICHGQGQTSA